MLQAVLAVLVAGLAASVWWLSRRLHGLEERLTALRPLKREVEELRGEVDRGLAVTRTHLAAVAAGESVPDAVIRKGSAWRDIESAEAQALWEVTPNLFVLDVRTAGEFASGHIPRSTLVPVDEVEDRVKELPPRDTLMLVTCAAGGRSLQACQILAEHGYTRLLNLRGGMHMWKGPKEQDAGAVPEAPPANVRNGTDVTYRGGPISDQQVVGAIRECFDPEIPLNVYDLGLIYNIDIASDAIAVRMTLTSEGCPSARQIPLDIKTKVAALGQENVTVDVVFDPPWHPTRISADGKAKLGLS